MEKGHGTSFMPIWIPFTEECFESSLNEIGPVLSMTILYFTTTFPWKKDMVFHLNKLMSPSLNEALCQVWLKLTLWFWRQFLNFVNVFQLFQNYHRVEKGVALHFNKIESPSLKDTICKAWLQLTLRFLRRWNVKFTDRQTTRKPHLSF